MGEVVGFNPRLAPMPGNLGSANEALIEVALTFSHTSREDAERWGSYILFELGRRGYMVVPVPVD